MREKEREEGWRERDRENVCLKTDSLGACVQERECIYICIYINIKIEKVTLFIHITPPFKSNKKVLIPFLTALRETDI